LGDAAPTQALARAYRALRVPKGLRPMHHANQQDILYCTMPPCYMLSKPVNHREPILLFPLDEHLGMPSSSKSSW